MVEKTFVVVTAHRFVKNIRHGLPPSVCIPCRKTTNMYLPDDTPRPAPYAPGTPEPPPSHPESHWLLRFYHRARGCVLYVNRTPAAHSLPGPAQTNLIPLIEQGTKLLPAVLHIATITIL
jgi:hypothetical protein